MFPAVITTVFEGPPYWPCSQPLQWRNWLAHGTYRTVVVSNAGVIYRCLLVLGALFSGKVAESRDSTFLVNFHRRYNVSKVAILRNNGYLPPASVPANFSPPEVIDNRARNVIATTNETRNYPNALLLLPDQDSLRALARKSSTQDERYPGSGPHPRRPGSPQGKHPRLTTMRSPPFLPPSPLPPVVETPMSSSANRISIEEMSCQNAGDDLFFRASVKMPESSIPPIVDNVMGEACRATPAGDSYRINFERDQFWDCGVADCSADGVRSYCLDLRFPVISGLRLKDDYRVTLRCKTQDRITYRTKRINLKTLEAKGRSIPNVLNGGSKDTLDVDVGLFRKTYTSENTFDTRIQPGGTVLLGEEILLRVLVNSDDGWKYSRMGRVTVHYVEMMKQQRNVVNSLWILDEDGCLNADVREICPREQYAASPLESYLILRAFMFDGMKETDEIFLTVRATACLEAADCVLDCPAGHVRRARRSAADRNNTIEWRDDNIALRVLLPKYERRTSKRSYYSAFLTAACASLALTIASVCLVKTFAGKRRKPELS
ncbi:PREDICTED: uncharacterized protein LOC106745835 [Dinoponera quadriceps]|uniref:Uncharacterized protein LOC106745835 n=1 Tax=Dinoponera quadriceps TaxID=609295 RepID=A0A6P3XGS5_DINQU|nr:PREDICTED: uncharacterized protein LOC106745835 [Dinoponera quadriceps]